ncbi:NAD(P)/FAD-dependent oxidoreductase [Paenibacillus sp. DR312]|uniref:NAD(P)/FAD-dependent oxidoreductase n=1 Tax=Paenibacillus sp. DR312 TaxID=2871175 RepID=UPI001C965117|nr:tryptophan 7-halogenase [Paenibacillus sp. DR312]QZN77668.1 tryptophan 7-halogenase [Paenibacillus sp. DR312]
MNKFDVVVIGGGPAGAAAAISCAQSGLEVLVVVGSQSRDRPGESLHPGIEPLLDRLGVGDRVRMSHFIRHEGYWVEWGKERHFSLFGSDDDGPWQGYQAWGSEFDKMLLDEAAAQGVQIMHRCFAETPIIEGQRVVGIKTTKGEIRSTWLLDCSGRNHWLARKFNLPIQRHSPRLFVQYGYVTGLCPNLDENPVLVGDETGWTWTAQVKPKVFQWTRLNFENFKWDPEWRPDEFLALDPVGTSGGADMTWRIVKESAGPGYWILGDAACVLDPLSSHGVQKAIMSGMMAAHCIARIATKGQQQEELVIQGYKRWQHNWFLHDAKELLTRYRQINPAFSFVKPVLEK